jgi:hypothetical protein
MRQLAYSPKYSRHHGHIYESAFLSSRDGMSLPNSRISFWLVLLFRMQLAIPLILLNQLRQIRSLLGGTYEFMFQQIFCRWSLSVSSSRMRKAYSSRISLDTLAHEILECSGEFCIVKLRGWIFGNDEQDLPSALSLDSGVLMSCTYFHRMQISIGWFTHSKLDSRDT